MKSSGILVKTIIKTENMSYTYLDGTSAFMI